MFAGPNIAPVPPIPPHCPTVPTQDLTFEPHTGCLSHKNSSKQTHDEQSIPNPKLLPPHPTLCHLQHCHGSPAANALQNLTLLTTIPMGCYRSRSTTLPRLYIVIIPLSTAAFRQTNTKTTTEPPFFFFFSFSRIKDQNQQSKNLLLSLTDGPTSSYGCVPAQPRQAPELRDQRPQNLRDGRNQSGAEAGADGTVRAEERAGRGPLTARL